MNIGGIDVDAGRHSGPGKSYRAGMSLVEFVRTFPDDEAARLWFESVFWPAGPVCRKPPGWAAFSG